MKSAGLLSILEYDLNEVMLQIDSRASLIEIPFSDGLEIAIAAKLKDHRDWALNFMRRLTETYPGEAAGHFEYAVLLLEDKQSIESARQAAMAYNAVPPSLTRVKFQYGLLLARTFIANSAWQESEEVLADISAEGDAETAELLAMRDFAAYMKETPKSKAQYITRKIRDKYYWMSTSEVAGSITNAIRESRPFALIRLGDGDGAHFRTSDRDEKMFPHLHAKVRRQHTEFLLGRDNDPVFTGYTAVTETLMRYVKEADILGIPYPSWVEHEYDICSPVTITCLMNINRHLYENETVDGLAVCNQLIHIELQHEKLIDSIMSEIESLTVISCLNGLPNKITEMFGIKDVDLIKIPSETYAPHLYGEIPLRISEHFPHAFWPTIKVLSRPHQGRVFLIAAGTFGKFYAAIIKRNGGIALDLGSLVDGWMKLASRPGYGELFAD